MMNRRMSTGRGWDVLCLSLLVTSVAGAGDCTPSTGPDLVVSDLWNGIIPWGVVDDIGAYSFGTEVCNFGDEEEPFVGSSDQHPVIASNMYRLMDGRFQQIGMSWVKHTFGALAGDSCCPCVDPGTLSILGVGCSDPYTAFTNGNQTGFGGVSGLGPRSDINPTTAEFPFPYTTQGMGGDDIYKRLQVHQDDLDPAQNPGALYFAEAIYIGKHDAAAGNGHNNVGYEEITVGGLTGSGWTLDLIGSTTMGVAAVTEWAERDASVQIEQLDVPGDGRYTVASNCTDNGDGTWRYEYAIMNINSHRAGQRFEVTIPASVNVSNIGFSDVDYHSGEPYDGADWTNERGGSSLSWFTDTFESDENANALRWGTMYNFWFDADAPPEGASALLKLFLPGARGAETVAICAPMGGAPSPDLDDDGDVDFDDLLMLLAMWGECPPDEECIADLDVSGGVGFADLLLLLSAWS